MTRPSLGQRLVRILAGLALLTLAGPIFLVGIGLFVGGIAESEWTMLGLAALALPPCVAVFFYTARLVLGRPRPDGALMSSVAFGIATAAVCFMWALAAVAAIANLEGRLDGAELVAVAAVVSVGVMWLWRRQMAARRNELSSRRGNPECERPFDS